MRLKAKNRVLSIALMVLLTPLLTVGQDVHFSQFFITPLAYNPAETGNFQGDFRLSLNHKKQWSAVENSYSTAQAAYDMPLIKGRNESTVGIGGLVYQDKAGITNFGVLNAGLSSSYRLPLSKKSAVRFGVQALYGQHQVDLSNVSWDSQFGVAGYDPALASNESIASQRAAWIDLGSGLVWKRDNKAEGELTIGASALHLNQPNVSFLGNTARMEKRFVLYIENNYALDEFILTPRLMYNEQGGNQEMLVGASIDKLLGKSSRHTRYKTASRLWLGTYYRHKDAVVLFTGIRLKNAVSFGVSYDIVTSSELSRPIFQQGLEFSISISSSLRDGRIKLR